LRECDENKREHNMLKHLILLSTALTGLACGGCESSTGSYNATVQGTVTIDGDLAPGGTVMFTPMKKGPVAVGAIASDGSYSLRIGQGTSSDPDHNKIPSGEYIATVEVSGPPGETKPDNEGGPKPAGPRLMADKYASKDTSDLKEEVTEGLNVIDLKLDGPWANPPKESDDETSEDDDENGDSEATGHAEPAETDSADTSEGSEDAGAPATPAANDAAPRDDQKEEQP
jgi:hypothetical protein